MIFNANPSPASRWSHLGKRMSRGSIPPPRPCSRTQLALLAPPLLSFRSPTLVTEVVQFGLKDFRIEIGARPHCQSVSIPRSASSRRFPSSGGLRISGVSFALARLGGSWWPRRVEAKGQPNLGGCVSKDMGLARWL